MTGKRKGKRRRVYQMLIKNVCAVCCRHIGRCTSRLLSHKKNMKNGMIRMSETQLRPRLLEEKKHNCILHIFPLKLLIFITRQKLRSTTRLTVRSAICHALEILLWVPLLNAWCAVCSKDSLNLNLCNCFSLTRTMPARNKMKKNFSLLGNFYAVVACSGQCAWHIFTRARQDKASGVSRKYLAITTVALLRCTSRAVCSRKTFHETALCNFMVCFYYYWQFFLIHQCNKNVVSGRLSLPLPALFCCLRCYPHSLWVHLWMTFQDVL